MPLTTVKIKKEDLLQVLQENRANHATWLAEVAIERKREMLDLLDNHVSRLESDDNFQGLEKYSFPMPQNNDDAYEKAIRMVELTQDKVIELHEHQFDCLVMDNWSWKGDFLRTSSIYGKLEA